MGTTLTVRVDSRQQKALARRAASRRTTVSAVVREILDSALDQRPMGERTDALRGQLALPPPNDPLRRRIRARNWRP
jgi:plasmid stability protein